MFQIELKLRPTFVGKNRPIGYRIKLETTRSEGNGHSN